LRVPRLPLAPTRLHTLVGIAVREKNIGVMRAKVLNQKLEDHPFQPLCGHLSDGTILPIPDARMVIVSDTTAIIPSE
jgi:hypothetical protein